MEQPARKALIIGLRLGKAALLAQQLAAAGFRVWVASADQDELSSLRRDDLIFAHRLFPTRIAFVHEVFESVDAHSGALDFVLFEAGHPEDELKAAQRISDSIKNALIAVISQSIRRMAPLARGWIYVHETKVERRGSRFSALFSKAQTLERLVEGAAAEAKAVGIRIEYLSADESLSESVYLTGLSDASRVEKEQDVRKQLLF